MNEYAAKVEAPCTIAHALNIGKQALAKQEAPYNEALSLLQHVLGKSKQSLIAHSDELLSDELYRQFEQCLQRRSRGEPIAYIVEQKEFWSLPLYVCPDVLVPRPETELLVETALEMLSDVESGRVLDLGTGSGCIALAIASERPKVLIHACDISSTCIQTAKLNATTLNIINVSFTKSNWFDSITSPSYDLIVSNPPYISRHDPALENNVRAYEPEQALIAKQNGLEDLQHIIQHAPQFLADQGKLVLEHGWQQAQAVRDLLIKRGYVQIRTVNDLHGHERVTAGIWNKNNNDSHGL